MSCPWERRRWKTAFPYLGCVSKNEVNNEDLLKKVIRPITWNSNISHPPGLWTCNTASPCNFSSHPGKKEAAGDPAGRSFEKVIEIYGSSLRRVDVVLFTYNLADHASFPRPAYWVKSAGKLMNDATHSSCWEPTSIKKSKGWSARTRSRQGWSFYARKCW